MNITEDNIMNTLESNVTKMLHLRSDPTKYKQARQTVMRLICHVKRLNS